MKTVGCKDWGDLMSLFSAVEGVLRKLWADAEGPRNICFFLYDCWLRFFRQSVFMPVKSLDWGSKH